MAKSMEELEKLNLELTRALRDLLENIHIPVKDLSPYLVQGWSLVDGIMLNDLEQEYLAKFMRDVNKE